MTSLGELVAQFRRACQTAQHQGAPMPALDAFLQRVPATLRGELTKRLNEVRAQFEEATCVLSLADNERQTAELDTSIPSGDTLTIAPGDSTLSLLEDDDLADDDFELADQVPDAGELLGDAPVARRTGVTAAGDLTIGLGPSASEQTQPPGSEASGLEWTAADPAATIAPASAAGSSVTGEFSLAPEQAASQGPSAPPAPSAQRRGKYPQVAGYEILSELGRGGMGVVYKARQRALNRLVALKMILAGSHAGPDQLARFRAEAEAVAQLHHPNIVQIYDVGEQRGLPYFSLEFIDGQPLDRFLDGKPQLATWAAAMTESLARAMYHAHEQGIVHRDLKPANVLLDSAGTPKITDFGLVKRMEGDHDSSQTRTGTIMGTPSYMAPEQGRGEKDIGPLADVYALGSMLYAFLTGRPPFLAATPLDTLMQLLKEEPLPPSRLEPRIPRDLETICLKCLQKDCNKRYGSALELAEDLKRFSNQEPILARPVGRLERVWRWCRRNPRVAGLTTAVVLLLFAAIGAATTAGRHAARERETIADVRRQTIDQLKQVRAEIAEGDWQRAQTLLVHSDPLLHQASALEPEREQYIRALRQIEAYAQAKDLMNRVRYYGLFGARGTLPAAREACATFFRLYEDLHEHRGEGRWGLPPLSDAKRQLFSEDAFEVFVVATQVEMTLAAATGKADALREAGEQSLRWLDQAEVILPATRFLHLRRAQIYQQLGDTAAAEREQQLGRAIAPTSVVDRFWEAISEHRRGKEAKARGDIQQGRQLLLAACSQYAELLRIRPDHFWAYFDWAACQVELDEPGSLQDAVVGFTTCVQLEPEIAWPYFNRGLAYYRLQQLDSALTPERKVQLLELAVEDFTTAIERNADYGDAYYNRGLMYAALNKDEQALVDIAAAMKLDASNPIFYYQRAEIYRKQKKYDQAREDYAQAIALDPMYYEAYATRGASYIEQQDFRGALPDFTRLVELRPNDPGGYERRGTCYLLAKDLAAAEADYRKLIELRPDDAMAHYRLSITHRVRRQYEPAAAALERSIALNPQNFRAYLMLSHVVARQGNFDRARELLELVRPLVPQDPAAQSGYLNDQGDFLRSREQWDEAAAAYTASRELLPAQVDAFLGLAAVRQAQARSADEIAEIYDQMVASNPAAASYLRRAEYRRDLGRFDEALADCQKARELDPASSLPAMVEASLQAAQGEHVAATTRAAELATADGSAAFKYAAAAVWSLAARSASADPQASEEAVAAYRTRAGELLLQAWEEGFLEFSLQQYNRVAHEPAFAELRGDPRLATLFEPRAL